MKSSRYRSKRTTRRVLVVEDNPADHVLVSHSLTRARGHFELDWARRLADARTLLADSDSRSCSCLATPRAPSPVRA